MDIMVWYCLIGIAVFAFLMHKSRDGEPDIEDFLLRSMCWLPIGLYIFFIAYYNWADKMIQEDKEENE